MREPVVVAKAPSHFPMLVSSLKKCPNWSRLVIEFKSRGDQVRGSYGWHHHGQRAYSGVKQ
jgi:hypothetical protein